MKQAAAILLLGIFSFNIFGYRIVYQYMADKADMRLETALDKNAYANSQLISIKQATNLPYYQNNKEFKRMQGEVKMNGIIYRYVKCRVYNDSLEMLCIPNIAKMNIENSREEFSKIANEFQQDNTKKKGGPEHKQSKTFSVEFELVDKYLLQSSSLLITSKFNGITPVLSFVVRPMPERPPSLSC